LSLIGDKLDQKTANRLRAVSRGGDMDEAWMTLELADDDTLVTLLKQESPFVAAVLVSKLTTDKAARLLVQLGPDLAQTLALGIAQTEAIGPDAVARIGATLAEQINTKPPRAFNDPPKKRVGEILNSSSAELRDSVLERLDSTNSAFADEVRKSIFTFKDIATRVKGNDVPLIMRSIDGADISTVIAANAEADAPCIAFLLENMSKRAAQSMRDDASTLPPPSALDHGAAASRIAAAVRALVDTQEITLQPREDDISAV
jgi:flagellar motor switch protein FliG